MNNLDLETLAYLTQLTEDIRPFLTEEGEIQVIERPIAKELRRRKKNEESVEDLKGMTHMVVFKVLDQGAEIKLIGFGTSLEEAAKKAKEATVKYFGDMINDAIPNAERNNEINAILNKQNVIH